MDCSKLERWLDDQLDQRKVAPVSPEIREHLEHCSTCRGLLAGYRFLAKTLEGAALESQGARARANHEWRHATEWAGSLGTWAVAASLFVALGWGMSTWFIAQPAPRITQIPNHDVAPPPAIASQAMASNQDSRRPHPSVEFAAAPNSSNARQGQPFPPGAIDLAFHTAPRRIAKLAETLPGRAYAEERLVGLVSQGKQAARQFAFDRTVRVTHLVGANLQEASLLADRSRPWWKPVQGGIRPFAPTFSAAISILYNSWPAPSAEPDDPQT